MTLVILSVNIIDEAQFKNINCVIHKAYIKIYTYGASNLLKVLGAFDAEIKTLNNAVINVIEGLHGFLLSCDTAVKLCLRTLTNQSTYNSHNDILNKYSKLFENIGKLKNYKAKLNIDDTVKPVAIPHRRIPFHIHQKVEIELKYLEEQDIIKKVNGSNPWVLPIITPPKPNNLEKIRMCIDMKFANKVI